MLVVVLHSLLFFVVLVVVVVFMFPGYFSMPPTLRPGFSGP